MSTTYRTYLLLEARIRQSERIYRSVVFYELYHLLPFVAEMQREMTTLLSTMQVPLESIMRLDDPHWFRPPSQLMTNNAMVVEMVFQFSEVLTHEFGIDVFGDDDLIVHNARESLQRYQGDDVIHVIPMNNVSKIKTKSKVLKKVLLDVPTENICGICLENHKKKDSVVCNCSHEFGKECFQEWQTTCQKNNKNVNCPSCRKTVSEIITFRERAKKVLL